MSEIANARLAGATGAAGAVHVDFRRLGEGVVDDVREVRDVDAARRDVGRDEIVQVLVLHPAHHALAILLRQVARDRLGVDAALAQELGDQRRVLARVAEDDGAVGLLDFEHAHQIAGAPHAAHHVVAVRDLVHADEVGRELDLLRLAHVARADALDVFGDRRREEQRLAFGRAALDDLGDLLEEAHRQHLVGLVEHQDLQAVEASVPRRR